LSNRLKRKLRASAIYVFVAWYMLGGLMQLTGDGGSVVEWENGTCPDTTCRTYCRIELHGALRGDAWVSVNGERAAVRAGDGGPGLWLVTVASAHRCVLRDKRLITATNSMSLTKYIGSLPLGVVLFGVTVGGAPGFMSDILKHMDTINMMTMSPELRNLSSEHIVLFRAMKGHASYAQHVAQRHAASWTTQMLVTSPQIIKLNPVSLEDVESRYPTMVPGHGWRPEGCVPRWTIAVIIPFRNRQHHLNIFLRNFLRVLMQQRVGFHVFVIEQRGPEIFNRAALLNVGYVESQKHGHFDCYAFHDVDHLPEDACNLYACSPAPRHLSVAKDTDNYRLPYHTMFGGASLLSEPHMKRINGFPNTFFGWGGEDDNIFHRLHYVGGYNISRYASYVARYTTLSHRREQVSNPSARRGFVESRQSAKLYWKYDGLSSLQYSVHGVRHSKLYTTITVSLPGPTNTEQLNEYHRSKMQEFAMLRTQDTS
jgi:beta-1,4-galactosyltransferase 1